MVNDFYVYCHRRKTDGKCFYIGKGKGNRAHTSYSRNRYWYEIVKEHGFEVEILVNNISEDKAFELEAKICEKVGYDNLINIRTELGWGGHSHSKNTIKLLSKPVLQYDLTGILIKTWNNTKTASDILDINPSSIASCLSGKHKTAGGYIWKKSLSKKGGNHA